MEIGESCLINNEHEESIMNPSHQKEVKLETQDFEKSFYIPPAHPVIISYPSTIKKKGSESKRQSFGGKSAQHSNKSTARTNTVKRASKKELHE